MKMVFQVYIEGTVEAVEFYCKAFNAKLGMTGINEDGTYMHAEIKVNNKCIMYLSEANGKSTSDKMQFCLSFDGNKEAVERAYEVLSEGNSKIGVPLGKFEWGSYGASLIDKFGVHWYIADK